MSFFPYKSIFLSSFKKSHRSGIRNDIKEDKYVAQEKLGAHLHLKIPKVFETISISLQNPLHASRSLLIGAHRPAP